MFDDVPLLSASNLHKTYHKDAVAVPVLRGLDLDLYPGEFLSVAGVSGSGKSTLLHLLGTLDRPDEGSIHLARRAHRQPPIATARSAAEPHVRVYLSVLSPAAGADARWKTCSCRR